MKIVAEFLPDQMPQDLPARTQILLALGND